jgi:hypothetical protein
MTIFIVLIFQVLFVFFAMVTNVGLVVHEKINLQNSADIAAMYGAQKQAEILNAIAHTNYQIWQAWKMLAFRVRVLGDFGRKDHPLRAALQTGALAPDTEWPNVKYNPAGGNPTGVYPPVVCVNHPGWMSGSPHIDNSETNICKSSGAELGTRIPQLPNVRVVFPPVDAIVKSIFDGLNDQIQDQCVGAGGTNWMVAAKFLVTYRFDVFNKLKRIKQLKEKLEAGLDIEGKPIREGVEKTLRANLTGAAQVQNIQWINPFDNLSPDYKELWLNPIRVHPAIFFVNQRGTSGCDGQLNALYQLVPDSGIAVPGGSTRGFRPGHPLYEYSLEQVGTSAPWDDRGLLRSTIGVEKNPWVMIYSGVRVSTRARKPFFPIGNAHDLTASSYAQPFGASIGPWAKAGWVAGSFNSSGEKIDKQTPEPWIGDGAAPPIAEPNVPNFSRYPGDPLGLRSRQALSEAGIAWKNLGLAPLKMTYYQPQPLAAVNGGLGESLELTKRLEAVFVAPNLYDVTYYSIEPNALKLYNERDGLVPQNAANVLPDYADNRNTIRGQVQDAALRGLASGNIPYRIKDWKHLLTSWTASNPSEYQTPTSRFGTCSSVVATDGSPSTGDCVAGGRTGYSVKLVSEDYLRLPDLSLGGTAGTGAILNPPPGG